MKIPPKEKTLRRPLVDEDCSRTELWRSLPCAGAEGAKRDSVNLSGKRTELTITDIAPFLCVRLRPGGHRRFFLPKITFQVLRG